MTGTYRLVGTLRSLHPQWRAELMLCAGWHQALANIGNNHLQACVGHCRL